MLKKMLSEERSKGRWTYSVSSGPRLRGKGAAAATITAKAEKRQKFPLFFSDVYLLICQELFSVNSEKLLKNQSKAKPAVHNNHYAHLHSFHTLLPASHPASPPLFNLGIRERVIGGK